MEKGKVPVAQGSQPMDDQGYQHWGCPNGGKILLGAFLGVMFDTSERRQIAGV